MKKLLFAASLALAMLNLGVARAASPGDGFGGYTGGGTPDGFGNIVGNTMTVGTDYLNASGWPAFEAFTLSTPTSTWVTWENAVSGNRRMLSAGYDMLAYGGPTTNNYAACAAGSYDTHFTNLANNIIASGLKRVALRLEWEFNGNWTDSLNPNDPGYFPNGDTTNFIGCWQHFDNAVRAVDPRGANQVIFLDFNRTAGCCSGGNQDGYLDDAYWPGDSHVDFIGYDLYDVQSNSSTQSQLAAIAAYAKTHGKKISFPEWAVQSGGGGQGDDPNFIQIMHDFMANPANNVAYESYFDYDCCNSLFDLSHFPQSQARLQQLFASPYANPVSMFTGGTTPTAGKFAHTVVVMLENHSYSDIQAAIQNGSMPWLASIVNSGALMTNSYAASHPSEPNYYMLWAGSTFGVTDDNAHAETGPTLKSEGAASSPAVTVTEWYDGTPGTDQFDQHLPQTSFAASPDSGGRGTAFSSFPTTSAGFASMVPLSLVVPSYCHDAHDVDGLGLGCSDTNATELTSADSWMQSHLGPYLTWAFNNNSALVIQFDESQSSDTACSSSGGTTCGGHIFTFFAGQGIVPGQYSEQFNTAELHTTLASMASVTLSGSDPSKSVVPLVSIFGAGPPPPPPPPPPATGCTSSLPQDTMCVLASSDVCKDSASPPLSQQDAIVQLYVDGTATGSPFTVTANRASGNATQEFDLSLASVSAASHTIGFQFTNDYFPSCDRNAWISTVKLNGTTYSATSDSTYGTQATVNANGWGPTGWYPLYDNTDVANFDSVSVTHPSAPTPPAAPACPSNLAQDTACFMLNEDLTGSTQNATAQLYVDGTAFGSAVTVTANHATAWQEADISLSGVSAGNHAIEMHFMNGEASPVVKHLYVGRFALNGSTIPPSADSTYGATTVELLLTGDKTRYDSVSVTHPVTTVPEQFNGSQKNAGLTLTSTNTANDTLTISGTNNVDRMAYGVNGVTTSPAKKVYWETVITSGTAPETAGGIGLTTAGVGDGPSNWIGVGTDSVGWYGNTGGVYNNGTAGATWAAYGTAATLDFALDTGNCKLWGRANNGNWDNTSGHDPATNTGGYALPASICATGKTIVPGAEVYNTANGLVAHFAASTFVHTIPNGFTSWDGAVPTPTSTPEQLDPNHKNSNLTLSKTTTTNDTATFGGTTGTDRLVFAKNGAATSPAQKLFWQVTFTGGTAATAPGLGLSTSSTADTVWMGSTSDTVGWYGSAGTVYNNGSSVGTWGTYGVTDTLDLALDTGACKLWGRVNTGNWNASGTDNPATGAGGYALPSTICSGGATMLPGVVLKNTGNAAVMHFSSSTWSHAAPSGYGSWDSVGSAPAETLTVNQPPYHGVAQTITGAIANISSAPSSLDMVVNGLISPASCSTLTAAGFACSWTPATAGSYTIQFKDHGTGAISPVVNVVVN